MDESNVTFKLQSVMHQDHNSAYFSNSQKKHNRGHIINGLPKLQLQK